MFLTVSYTILLNVNRIVTPPRIPDSLDRKDQNFWSHRVDKIEIIMVDKTTKSWSNYFYKILVVYTTTSFDWKK